MANLIYRYDEVAAGEVRHPIRFASESISPVDPLWPATRSDGRDEDPDAMPMGARLRLRADADLGGLGPQARVVAVALQQYGAVLADTTTGWGFTGEGDERWDDADLGTLRSLDLDQFEVVDTSAWKVADDSFQAAR